MHSPQIEVILRHGDAELARLTLPPGEYVIGRGAEAQVHADTPLISRRHALLTLHPDHAVIEDLGSSNGTFVADQPIAGATRIATNQDVRLGDVALEIRGLAALTQSSIRRLLPDEILTTKRYSVGGVVARGGMGAILDAQQLAIGRTVAMKVMLEAGEEADVVRFIDEAKITGQLDHPNIVPIYEIGVDAQGQVFYTMKMVRGITLKKVLELLAEGVEATVKKFPLCMLLTVFQKACDAIAFAHAKGVIHRDLKPENIMLGDFGSVLVMDWGLAKIVSGSASRVTGSRSEHALDAERGTRNSKPETGFQTMAGTIMGTPQYMAPEQARGEVETMDQRADLYALGGILFHILHLRPAVSGDDAWDIVARVARGALDWTPPKKPVPDSLVAVCRKALALSPAQRYASVEELQCDITAYQNGFATSAENAGWFKQVSLAIKRNKTVSLAAALVLTLGGTLGTKAVLEGKRAERALADLKKSAPAMLALAESEAVAQHFDSELEKVDVALRLDPDLLPAYWRRAWCFVALGRFSDAAAALKKAAARDPSHAPQFVRILPQIEMIAGLPDEAARNAPEVLSPVFDFLNSHDVRGEAGGLVAHLKLSNEKRFEIAKDRLKALTGGWTGLTLTPGGLIVISFSAAKLTSLEQLRGIPFDILNADKANFESLEPLRGLRLVEVNLNGCGFLKDLSPLAGMPVRKLNLFLCIKVEDLSPVRGMPLEEVVLDGTKVADLRPLAGMQLHYINVGPATDLRPLAGMPLEAVSIQGSMNADLSPLAGLPLKMINGTGSTRDLTPLLRIPTLERLTTSAPPAVLYQLRKHPKLASINHQNKGYRPAAEVWAELDARQAGKK
jgi:serine/threonine protein kinase